ncbi:MAG: cation transporter [Desulfuromonas sp.]|nr:MAG: cation transporter [Desulfuromonas sp.]
MVHSAKKIGAARLSVVTAGALTIIKLSIGIVTGSMAVLASAVDSILDILMSSINFYAIKKAEEPADECHPFGHGKYETVATVVQAFVIAISGSWIIFEATRRLIQGSELKMIQGGIAVLIFSTLISLAISRYLRKVAKETDSSALEADSLHFSMDVYTNLALAGGLFILQLTGYTGIDPILSILVGAYIIVEAFKLVRHGMRDVLDAELPPAVMADVTRLLDDFKEDLVDYRNLRTRRAGSQKFMDFDLVVCRHMSIEEAHDIADKLEAQIKSDIPGADITIHLEPCLNESCPGMENCTSDKMRVPGK